MTAATEPPRSAGPRPQGGRPADHRPHPLDRQHPPARHAAHRDRAQPVRARPDHRDRHRRGARRRPASSAVFTGADLADEQGGLPCAWPITADMKAPAAPVAGGRARAFAGEIVAVVVARTAAEARDAAELVEVDYDDRSTRSLDMEAALADGRHARAPGPRHQQVRHLGRSTPARPAPAATSTRRSPRPRPTPTRSWSGAASASSG